MQETMQVQNEQDLHEIEVTIEQARDAINMYDMLKRLRENEDFKKLIAEHYLDDYANNLVFAKANPSMQEEEKQEAVNRQLTAISELNRWFVDLQIGAMQAERAIERSEATREEILAEM